jgi:PAS domain S-box-containing protein
MRILYVEDNPQDADLVCRALAAAMPDARVEVAPTQAVALRRLADAAAFEVLLTDLNLPDGNGLDLIVEARARRLPLAVVALTGLGDEAVVMAALKAGADDYLPKSADMARRLPATLRTARARFSTMVARPARALRVLYAEHNAHDLDLTRRYFAAYAAHIQVQHAGDAAAVLACLPHRDGEPAPVDVLLVDHRLPGESGLEVLKLVREELGLDLPVVIVTGQGSEEVAAMAMRLGATDYVVKHQNYLVALPAVLENAFHRVQAERERDALARSEQRLALVLRGSNDASWDLDLVHGDHYFSPRLWQLLGQGETTPPAADLALLESLLHPSEAADVRQRVRQLLDGAENAFELELRLARRDGAHVPVLVRGYISRDAGGHALRVSGTCTDLTERKRAEAEIRELNASLEARVASRTQELQMANQELEAFTYSVSHDLRAPLRAVDALAALLQQNHGTSLGPQGQEHLRLLRASTASMARLINDLLDFARTARQVPSRITVPTAALVRRCIEEFRTEIDARGIRVEVGELPPCNADPGLLRQVFVNLIGNAVKYTRRQPQPHIEIATRDEAGSTVFSVRDNGAGFDMRQADKLFAPFQRLHAASEFEGSGVGLAIVERIVRRHGGRVWAEGTRDVGASFHFTLDGTAAAPARAGISAAPAPG